ncbi:MAG TPA: hypothetical protein VK517_14425 [Cyclobacteriaceae bacterium]|nr:hypothetical protein [Cyclobacteriaceae bacterium]
MKKSILAGLVILFSVPGFSQTTPETIAVMVPVTQLFKGMNLGDSAKVHSAFVNEVTFVTVAKDKNGKPALIPEPLDQFLVAVGTPHEATWNEPIWDVVIHVDGIFAQVWAKYAFYLDKKFSHCGVDAFHLIKGEDGQWRIFHLADTRQREGCVVPGVIGNQFK